MTNFERTKQERAYVFSSWSVVLTKMERKQIENFKIEKRYNFYVKITK